jgi:transcriptional regulator with XRE-family HTH domain
MVIGQKIKELRSERGWTQNELAQKSGVDRGALASIETGKAKHPKTANLLKLARAFNIRPEELYQAAGYIQDAGTVYQRPETPEELLQRFNIALPSSVPIYEEFPFHAGEPVEPVEYLPIVKDRTRKRNLEGYIVRGECLTPEIQDKDIIIIDRDAEIQIGDIVACMVNSVIHLARLRRIGGELFLENNTHRMRLEEATIAAPVIEVRRRLK